MKNFENIYNQMREKYIFFFGANMNFENLRAQKTDLLTSLDASIERMKAAPELFTPEDLKDLHNTGREIIAVAYARAAEHLRASLLENWII